MYTIVVQRNRRPADKSRLSIRRYEILFCHTELYSNCSLSRIQGALEYLSVRKCAKLQQYSRTDGPILPYTARTASQQRTGYRNIVLQTGRLADNDNKVGNSARWLIFQ